MKQLNTYKVNMNLTINKFNRDYDESTQRRIVIVATDNILTAEEIARKHIEDTETTSFTVIKQLVAVEIEDQFEDIIVHEGSQHKSGSIEVTFDCDITLLVAADDNATAVDIAKQHMVDTYDRTEGNLPISKLTSRYIVILEK